MRVRTMLAGLFAVAIAGPVPAAMFCVGNATQLNNALNSARNNGEHDDVRMVPGVYTRQPDVAGGYMFSHTLENGRNFSLSGGWNATCTSQTRLDPAATVIDGQLTHRLLLIGNGADVSGDVQLRNFTLQRGFTTTPFGLFELSLTNASPANAWFDNLRFIDNVKLGDNFIPPVRVTMGSGTLRVRSSVFVGNSTSRWGALGVSSPGYVYLNNNTIVGNVVTGNNGKGGLILNGDGIFALSNNLIWGNIDAAGEHDVYVGAANVTARSNHFGPIHGSFAVEQNSTWGDAKLVSFDEPRPRADSPLRNSGMANPSGGSTSQDASGHARVQEGTLDRGAFESEALLSSGFE